MRDIRLVQALSKSIVRDPDVGTGLKNFVINIKITEME